MYSAWEEPTKVSDAGLVYRLAYNDDIVAFKMGRRSGLGRTVRAGLAVRGRISKSIRNRSGSRRPIFNATLGAAAGWLFFRPAAAGLARPVSIQIWALRSRLEKQSTDPAPAGRRHHYMRDGTLGRISPSFQERLVAILDVHRQR